MGNKKSLLQKPFKNEKATFDENQSEKLMKEIKNVKINTEKNGNRTWNFLLLGPCGAGKSSFINSVISVSKGKYLNSAFSGGLNLGSITSKFKSYSGDNLRFYDTAGLMETQGFNTEMMDKLLKGHVKEGYEFSSKSVIAETDEFYRENPTMADRMHCVIYLVDICSLSTMDKTLKEKIIRLQQNEIDSDIMRVLILTKCDELCDYVKSDVTNIYKSKNVCDEAENARNLFGIAGGNTHPVVNYGERVTEINPAMNVPILLALKQCVDFSHEYIEQQKTNDAPVKNDE